MINLKPLTSTLAASMVVTVMGAFDVANAATFTFSFMNEDGLVDGTVEGVIELPDGDGTFAASSVTVTSAPAALGFTLPFDVFSNFPNIIDNSFTVSGGNIDVVASTVLATNGFQAFFLNNPAFGTQFAPEAPNSGVADNDNSTLVYSSVSVPEPTSMIALAGVGLLGVASKLKKKA
ncbi:MAG: PEP-CTERM sorting domain-containing protein [Crocosphaera sp.]|nr:PEP-CTERM sorting domain-containing protein [Crocosphaera sp.]